MLSEHGTQRQFAIGETEGTSDGRLDPAGLHKPWLAVHIHPMIVLNLLDEPFAAIHSRSNGLLYVAHGKNGEYYPQI